MSTELQGKREKLVHDAREALEEIKKNTDESRATELEQRHDTIMGELDKIDAAIEREARVAKAEARSEELRASKRPQPRDGEERTSSEAPEYREVFHKFLRSGAEMDALTSEERKVLRTGAPQDGAEFRVQTAGTNSAGGYTVPVELMNEIVKSMAATGPMYDANIVRELNTSSGNQINIPTVDDTAGTASLHTEAAALTDDNSADATLGQKRLDAYVYDTKFVRWSMELGQDSIFNVEALLGELLGERLGRKANSILTTGTGSSQPNGIVTAASSGVTAAAVAAITCDELLDLPTRWIRPIAVAPRRASCSMTARSRPFASSRTATASISGRWATSSRALRRSFWVTPTASTRRWLRSRPATRRSCSATSANTSSARSVARSSA
jgi:HK97 family phage major capsid protein